MGKITVLGAGNGACATAADLALRGFPLTLCSRPDSTTLRQVQERGGLEYTGLLGEGFTKIGEITSDLHQAVKGADLIIIVVPGKGHEYYAHQLAPLLEDGQKIFLSPGHTGGGLRFQRILRETQPNLKVRLAEVNSLPYGCRLVGPARVWVYLRNQSLLFGALPSKYLDEMKNLILDLYPTLVTARNVIETGMNYLNAIIHVAGMIMNTGWIEFTKGDFYYYYEGITPAVGRTIEALDRERVEGLKRLGLPPSSFLDIFYRAGYTTQEAWASGSIYRAFQESEVNKSRKSPQDLNHRYLMEDCPYGILPMSEFCHWVGAPTPVMDALVTLSSVATGIDFRKEGLTLERMGLVGLEVKHMEEFLFEGF